VTRRAACDNASIARSRLLGLAVLACGVPSLLLSAAACSSSGDGGNGKSTGGASSTSGGATTGGTSPGALDGGTGGSAGQSSGATSTGGTSVANGAGGATASGSGTGGVSGSSGTSAAGGLSSSGAAAGTSSAAAGSSARGGRSAGGAAGRGTAGSGATGAAGASASAPVCATAAENDAATLSCPTGQIIDSVVFASFGTPTGTCGNFATSDCDATSSVSTVQSMCVGKSSCSVTAANGTFGDPCHGTTKKIAIEVTCVPGTPTTPEPSTTPYKGIANSPAAEISALGATWCYNWGATPKSTDCNDPYFVPMIWGSSDVSSIDAIAKAGYTTVLGFNEPNKSDQANMSVADAIALWPQITANANIRVGSPAVSDDGRSWLEDFMTQAKQQGLRVDFIAMHWYGWNAGSCVASQLEGAVTWASQWGLPVWITEFGCMGSSNPDEQTVLDFFNNAIPMLAKHPLVERYAWYPWNTYNDVYTTANPPVMTALGQAFAAAPQYHP